MPPVLSVEPNGNVTQENLDFYLGARRQAVATRLETAWSNPVAQKWFEDFAEKELYEEKDGERKYMGDASAEEEAKAAIARAKSAGNAIDRVIAVEDFILCFCGFNNMKPLKARCIVNAVHYQFVVDVDRLLSTALQLPTAEGVPSPEEKAIFDDSNIGLAELLLRCVVEKEGGGLLANPFSPGMPMSKLLKLPVFAQFVMVLTNAVECEWYQEAVPSCPMSINVYASLLVPDSPVSQMIEGVKVVEIMEMTKGAKRDAAVDDWVKFIRDAGKIVMLDDFDAKHPGLNSKPDGIKVSVFANAFHSLQAHENKDDLLPFSELAFVDKEKTNPFDVVDFYGVIVPKYQSGVEYLVMEGSENCLKTKAGVAGSPLDFKTPGATIATAHVYQAAARALRATQPEGQQSRLKMVHQGGRGLYEDEDFDAEACAVIAATGKAMQLARTGDAGTMAWMGDEAKRRAEMQTRPLVSGLVKKS